MKNIQIWDAATRIYHWAQALLFMALMATGFKIPDHIYSLVWCYLLC